MNLPTPDDTPSGVVSFEAHAVPADLRKRGFDAPSTSPRPTLTLKALGAAAAAPSPPLPSPFSSEAPVVDFLLPPSGSRRGTIPTDDLVAALEGELGGGNVFVYRPGGEAGGNVYTSWALLHAALVAVEGPRVVFVDTSIETTAVIPVGDWDASQTVFVGQANVTGSSGDRLSILGSLQNPAGFENLVISKAAEGTGSPAIDLTRRGRCFLRNCFLGTLHASILAMKASTSDRIEIDLYNTDVQTPGLGAVATILAADDNGTYINIYEGTRLRDNALRHGGDAILIVRTLFCDISSTQSDGGGALTLSSGIFSYDRANTALEATSLPRFGPWRYSEIHFSGATEARKKERVLLDGYNGTLEVTTPANPNTGDTFSVKEATGGASLTLTVTATSGTVENPVALGTSGASAVFALGAGECVVWEWFDSNWYVVSKLG